MKHFSLLTWITQLGLSTMVPPVGLIWLAVWLRDRFGWGNWVVFTGIFLGIYCGIQGLYASLKTLKRLTEEKKDAPPIAFNDHN